MKKTLIPKIETKIPKIEVKIPKIKNEYDVRPYHLERAYEKLGWK